MKYWRVFLLCLLCSPVALAQTKPVLQLKSELKFGDSQERILTHKFLNGENKLLLVGLKTIRLLDVANAKFLESRSIETPEITEEHTRVISPDGRRMLIFGNYRSKDKVKLPASVWDLQTGKQIAALDKSSKSIRAGFWSKNGKTLATSSDKHAPFAVDDTGVEVSFWDGETCKYQNSLPASKINWWYLSNDGDKCFFSTAPVKNLLIIKYIDFTGGPISVWDTSTGKLEKTIPVSDDNVERKTRGISVSPDEKFLAFVTQKPKSNETEKRLAVWEIDKSDYPAYEIRAKYEIKPNPKIYEFGLQFSPDGKYFALDAGKTLQIYETSTGEKRFELPDVDNPNQWLNDDKILLYNYGSKMEAFEIATGKRLYQQKLVYVVSEYTDTQVIGDTNYDTPVRNVVDSTTIIVHPHRNLLLTYSKQYVKVYDSRTGELLQALISPPMDYSKKKPKLSSDPLISKADWSDDGKTLYVISADGKSISLWGLVEN